MDNKPLIIERATELFAARGYDGVGVQEIVESAGVTKPTLYHYFGSKQGLLEAVIASQAEALRTAMQPAADYQKNLSVTLRRIATGCFAFAQGNPTFARMQLSLFFAPPDSEGHRAVAGLNDLQFTALRDLFQKASRDHGNMKGRHVLYAASFLGMINNCIGLGLNGYLALDAVLVEKSVHQFEHGIYS
jgi:AcrR family transcriptional regulator